MQGLEGDAIAQAGDEQMFTIVDPTAAAIGCGRYVAEANTQRHPKLVRSSTALVGYIIANQSASQSRRM